MALDGVAPRAKMNQQRARRFRTARDALESKKKQKEEAAAHFDSNCITPGTEFMAQLTEHLKYFIHKKVSEDRNWRNVKIVLSGHEVPGEGEHKIMEYIRLSKSNKAYDKNTRHCLYGLDADLIMLGLLSHDVNFCLLREEVVFGRKQKKTTDVSSTNFYLMHLCLVREYLDKDFEKINLPFHYSLERIIDDFVLIAMFIGNDFIPHLPHVHIGQVKCLFETYKRQLPLLGGYVNEFGRIHLKRLQAVVNGLYEIELESFGKKSLTPVQMEIYKVKKSNLTEIKKDYKGICI